MEKKNCWEVMNCGREVNGVNNATLGLCPVALLDDFDGVNGGHNGGRFCWAVVGTHCAINCSQKLANCVNCKFLKQVNVEEGPDFILTPKKIKREKIVRL